MSNTGETKDKNAIPDKSGLEAGGHNKPLPRRKTGAHRRDGGKHGDFLPMLLGCGGLAILLTSLLAAVGMHFYRRYEASDESTGKKTPVKPEKEISVEKLVHAADVVHNPDGTYTFSWDWEQKSSDPELPIYERIPQLKDWQPHTVAVDPSSSALLAVTPKRSRIIFQGNLRVFMDIKLFEGDWVKLNFRYFPKEKTGYTVWLYRDGTVKLSQEKMAKMRAEQVAYISGESRRVAYPLHKRQWMTLEMDLSGRKVMIYVDSNLVYEGNLPGKWLIDDSDPAYKGGIPGKNFGENDTPPDFGELSINTKNTFEGIIRYIEITGRPTDAWIKQRSQVRLRLNKLLDEFSKSRDENKP